MSARFLPRCRLCGRLKGVDTFAGEGGAGVGYMRAGFCMDAVDLVPDRATEKGKRARLENYPTDCKRQALVCADAVEYLYEYGNTYAFAHASPTCTGYSIGTAALPDRLERYDRLIPVVRAVLLEIGVPYVIENVYGARHALINPVMLCGRMFGLSAADTDGTALTLDRHRMFESNLPLLVPPHPYHDWRTDRAGRVQVAGSYGGARRDKVEAREVRGGGYVPASLDVQRALLGTPWMSEKGCQLSIPPAYTDYLGRQVIAVLTDTESESVA